MFQETINKLKKVKKAEQVNDEIIGEMLGATTSLIAYKVSQESDSYKSEDGLSEKDLEAIGLYYQMYIEGIKQDMGFENAIDRMEKDGLRPFG